MTAKRSASSRGGAAPAIPAKGAAPTRAATTAKGAAPARTSTRTATTRAATTAKRVAIRAATTAKHDASIDAWFLYVVRCADGTLYTGIARDVAARLAQHEAGKGARYTRGRGPLALLAKMRCDGMSEALRIERRVKSLSRAEKVALVRRMQRRASETRKILLEGLRRDASC